MSILYLSISQAMSVVRRRALSPVFCRVRTLQLATTSGLCFIEEFILYFFRPCVGKPCGSHLCLVTLVVAEEGCCSIPITQRPSDKGRLRAVHEPEAASSIRSLPQSSIAASPKGFVDKIRAKKDNMRRKNPFA